MFKTSGTEHGTFHKTAKELHKQEEIMRRGGGVQKDESRVAEVLEEGKRKGKKKRRNPRDWRCVGCGVFMGEITKKNCSIWRVRILALNRVVFHTQPILTFVWVGW